MFVKKLFATQTIFFHIGIGLQHFFTILYVIFFLLNIPTIEMIIKKSEREH